MNTEEQLRNAATEMERATVSLTPPPIDDVRRTARNRGFGIAVAAAVGVVILVGGAVLLVRPSGTMTLGPAGPTETTVATTTSLDTPDSVPVRAAESGPHPLFDADRLGTQLSTVFPASAEVDIALALEQLRDRGEGLEYGAVEAIILGSGRGVRGYVLVGELEGRITESQFAYCSVLVTDSDLLTDCVPESDSPRLEITSLGIGTFALLGALPEGTSVVSLDLGEQQVVWTLAHEGFVFMAQPDKSAPGVVTVYDENGEVLVWAEGSFSRQEVDPTTTILPDTVGSSCSGAGLTPSALALSSIPQPVAETLWNIVDAAGECDFERLAAIGGDTFTASFGGGDPSELWTYEEEQGYAPMYHLMQILDMPHGIRETENGMLYMWPRAAAHDGEWDTVPDADKEALRPLYGDDDFEGFRQFGAYIGYRIGIWENGDWSFFVAGD